MEKHANAPSVEIRGVLFVKGADNVSVPYVPLSERRTVTYDGQTLEQVYLEELTNGDNILMVNLNEDESAVLFANLCLNMQITPPVRNRVPPEEIVVEFSGVMTHTDTQAAREVANRFLKRNQQ